AGIVVDPPAKTAENRAGGSVSTYRAIGHVHCPSTVPNTAAIVADRVASGSIIGNRAVADIDRAGTCVLNTAAEAAIAEGVYVTYREVGKAHRRSEERRVGKECRCGWWAYHDKKQAVS